ncbi:MAG: UbiX family flavin prenyltransferase [Bacteroidales bacterium]|nr:UbiX family flavin prenyltransferase [Bacteroidales bacterium]
MRKDHKIIIGVTGASGAIYAKTLFEKLVTLKNQIEKIDVVFSDNAKEVWKYELDTDPEQSIPFNIYKKNDFFAPFASGSAGYDIMIICPCSMGTLGRIATGTSDNLITRASDVILKERKKLILVPRETPFNLIHINNMKIITEAGGIICPASPSFYNKPGSIEDLVDTVVDRILQLADIKTDSFKWGETNN